jgi:uncharacterized protein (TIGR03435 family)
MRINLPAMRLLLLLLAASGSIAAAQAAVKAPYFDVASVRPSAHTVGPDYNNQLTFSPDGFVGRNVTLKRLVAEAYRLQLNQVTGPAWIGESEYDVDAKVASAHTAEQTEQMLQSLLADRFKLSEHTVFKDTRVLELSVSAGGPKIHPVKDNQTAPAAGGMQFHGSLREFADLLAVQVTMPAADNPNEPVRASQSQAPVLDKTGLTGIFDFTVNIQPEPGTDMFIAWQRVLQEQLGLKLEAVKTSLPMMVLDSAVKTPTPN